MYLDLTSGEAYGAVIYQDGETVIFWTLDLGASQARESQISAATFDQALIAVETGEGDDLVQVSRFQWFAADTDATVDQAADARRGQLAAYAEANGGQVLTHIEVPARWSIAALRPRLDAWASRWARPSG